MKEQVNQKDIKALLKDGFTMDVINKLFNVKKERNYPLSKDDVRNHAIRVLAVLDKLNQKQRVRVLNHALQMNKE